MLCLFSCCFWWWDILCLVNCCFGGGLCCVCLVVVFGRLALGRGAPNGISGCGVPATLS